jgi:hypothetical protein
MSFDLGAGGRLEMAFRCGVVVDRTAEGGQAAPDLQIWSTVRPGGQALVEVSLDGTTYAPLDFLTSSNQTFDLARIGARYIRFVRIADEGQGGIGIDALQAL